MLDVVLSLIRMPWVAPMNIDKENNQNRSLPRFDEIIDPKST